MLSGDSDKRVSASASDFGAEKAKTNAGAAIGRPQSGTREESFFA
jgi:hypothetical protein